MSRGKFSYPYPLQIFREFSQLMESFKTVGLLSAKNDYGNEIIE